MTQIISPDAIGYYATPEIAGAPSIFVIQEIFGLNAIVHAIADALAGKGYTICTGAANGGSTSILPTLLCGRVP